MRCPLQRRRHLAAPCGTFGCIVSSDTQSFVARRRAHALAYPGEYSLSPFSLCDHVGQLPNMHRGLHCVPGVNGRTRSTKSASSSKTPTSEIRIGPSYQVVELPEPLSDHELRKWADTPGLHCCATTCSCCDDQSTLLFSNEDEITAAFAAERAAAEAWAKQHGGKRARDEMEHWSAPTNESKMPNRKEARASPTNVAQMFHDVAMDIVAQAESSEEDPGSDSGEVACP